MGAKQMILLLPFYLENTYYWHSINYIRSEY